MGQSGGSDALAICLALPKVVLISCMYDVVIETIPRLSRGRTHGKGPPLALLQRLNLDALPKRFRYVVEIRSFDVVYPAPNVDVRRRMLVDFAITCVARCLSHNKGRGRYLTANGTKVESLRSKNTLS